MWANDSSYLLKENLYGLLKIIMQIYINECLKTTVKKTDWFLFWENNVLQTL